MSIVSFEDFYHNGYLISMDKDKMKIDSIRQFLDEESYWARGIPLNVVEQSVSNSVCIGVFKDEEQVGFGRMITDKATFGYLADIYIREPHRRKGLSKILMRSFCDLADGFGLRRFILTTQDAHGLYEQFGFRPFPWPERMMYRHGIQYGEKK